MKAEEVRRTCTFIVTATSQAEGTATINHCSIAQLKQTKKLTSYEIVRSEVADIVGVVVT